ncbi:Type I restriction modification DNA specificity domain [Vibrio sp. B1ASS3]|uniref:restriction endonuclease subunit S n=1 Tax=Vibrio sp. B1ASS3 TaxID=2751176 RepID=UPI001ABB767E|nr:restriction endonuclease subunit S [Vibrio sp. B1ASS3]CAD7800318.1 Type I restriction modification DNA specificity domain [Vibrio sp. B1ASS3]CAE6887352.1 Type I restriction modification DNA specificity domain [Vibrio sp. B1ASS3]
MSKYPSDWKSQTLGDLVTLQRGYDLPSQNRINGEVPIMSAAGLAGYHNTSNVSGPGIVIGRSGSGFGNVHYSEQDFWAHNTALFVKDFKNNDNQFVYYILKSIDFTKHNSGGVQPSLNRNFIYPISVGIPPLLEQQKIAQILSTWDKAIATTEKLIETSKQQKKALMQQLLTGKKRLVNPETGKVFEDEWEFVRAGNVFQTRSNKKHNSDLPILAITQDKGAIPRELIDYNVSVTNDSISGYKVVEQGDFIISLRSFQGGIEYSKYKGICSPAYVILYPKIKIVDAFYKYHLKSHPFIQAMKSRLEGIRDGKIISYKYFSEIKLPQPSLKEQQKIASVLTASDKEIELLEVKLAHFKQEKKALMQQLLTGKRRVKMQDVKAQELKKTEPA